MLSLLEGFFEEWDSGDSIRVVCGFYRAERMAAHRYDDSRLLSVSLVMV